jgi:hypothetical protein
MSEAQIDPEQLAAFLDGTASATERDAVLQEIASSGRAYAEFVEAAALIREMEPALTVASGGEVKPSEERTADSGSRRRGYIVSLALLAACLALFFGVRRFRSHNGDVIQLAQATQPSGPTGAGSIAKTLGVGWDEPGWSVTRGAETTRGTTERAFRAGLRFAQMEFAVNARDSVATGVAATRLEALLSDIGGSAPVSARLYQMSQPSSFGDVASRARLASQLRDLLEASDRFNLGVWTGAAQISATNGQTSFFSADGEALAQLTTLLAASPQPQNQWLAVTEALKEVRRAGNQDMNALAAIRAQLVKVVSAAGG